MGNVESDMGQVIDEFVLMISRFISHQTDSKDFVIKGTPIVN